MYDLIVIGGGPAGIFAALQAKKRKKEARILILEKSSEILKKIKISGGGRCNVTQACFDPKKLIQAYPRGKKELLEAFYKFSPKDMILWLESKGISLKTEKDSRVFPSSNKAQTILDCFLKEIKKNKIEIRLNQSIDKILKSEKKFKIFFSHTKEILLCQKLLLATGGEKKAMKWAETLGHQIKNSLIPSLFSFKLKKELFENQENKIQTFNSQTLCSLSGLSRSSVMIKIKNTSFKQIGPVLITHEGLSGPAIINLSAFAAKYLFDCNYQVELIINWLGKSIKEADIEQKLRQIKKKFPKRQLGNIKIFDLPKKLWLYLLNSFADTFKKPLKDVSNEAFKLLVSKFLNDCYQVVGKSTNKQEFVNCGGINLKEVDFKDMQSKICKNLYFAGEILDIDGITGGYNFQNCWTTGYIAGSNIF